MFERWTVDRQIGLGLFALLCLCGIVGAFGVRSTQSALAAKDRAIEHGENLADAQQLRAQSEYKSAAARGYLLGGNPALSEQAGAARQEFVSTLRHLRVRVDTDDEREILGDIEEAESTHQAALEALMDSRREGVPLESVAMSWEASLLPRRSALNDRLLAYIDLQEQRRDEVIAQANLRVTRDANLLVGISVAAVLLSLLGGVALARSLARQIGAAGEHIRTSSTQLQSAATQQASGSREQSVAMGEVATTMGELLTTSRLIAESAQAVAKIASTTANAARDGGAVVERTEESVFAIQEQVDAITTYMLDLGRKSQQIGAVVELITELAEQTNILAINATIEAGGAGEGGRRFAVVADEIRRLADRVGGSTKMIRGLVEDVRGSVNTTVMATESASKVVEAGTRQFSELAASFQQISGLVEASTEAAREIELSTKQQSTAVGQVNVAIANVAQSTRELETSTIQTLQTASELSALSQALMRIISSRADA